VFTAMSGKSEQKVSSNTDIVEKLNMFSSILVKSFIYLFVKAHESLYASAYASKIRYDQKM